jgi:uncharacterized YigZ family protein
MQSWLTVCGRGEAEHTVSRSRFIAVAAPAETEAACQAFFEEIRRKHHAARHNVPAYALAGGAAWSSDDGEPSGTAGAPVLSYLEKENIRDVALVVTRYFGGVKLGPGGLVRAYTQAAKLAVEAAGLCAVAMRLVLTFEMDYASYHRAEALVAAFEGGAALRGTVFGASVRAELVVDPGSRDGALKALSAALGGGKEVAVLAERTEAARLPGGQGG